MKQVFLSSLLTFLVIFATGCSKETKKTSGSSMDPYCQYNPYLPQCLGGGYTTGGQNPNCQVNPQLPGCPNSNHCQMYPQDPACYGSGGTGGTTGGTSTHCLQNPYAANCPFCLQNPQHMYCQKPPQKYPSDAMNPNWGQKYPPNNQPPAGDPNSCLTFTPESLQNAGFTPWDTRVGTVSIAGYNSTLGAVNPYDPSLPVASNYLGTSPDLKSINGVKMFLMTDSILKVRFKPRPQPDRTASSTSCYNTSGNPTSTLPGYTKLNFTVVLRGIKSNDVHEDIAFKNYYNVGVNSCTPGWDISEHKAKSEYANGLYFVIRGVSGNQGCSDNDYRVNGFGSCSTPLTPWGIQSRDCWTMDIEVAADGTKTFN